MSRLLLSIRGLSKAFGALTVTDAVDLDVAVGELHALIGPNGAGKTSLIQQVAGSLLPDAGSIAFDGHDVTSMPVAQRVRHGLARSFQITSILPEFTVLENVAVGIQARSGSSFRFWSPVATDPALNEPARAILDRVGIASRADVLASRLSHGEKRHLEIALALSAAPKLLLLDEPLAGVGREESVALIDLLRSLRSELTIVLVEHDMDAVFALADRISVLFHGRVIYCGDPAAVQQHPLVREAYLGDEEIPA